MHKIGALPSVRWAELYRPGTLGTCGHRVVSPPSAPACGLPTGSRLSPGAHLSV